MKKNAVTIFILIFALFLSGCNARSANPLEKEQGTQTLAGEYTVRPSVSEVSEEIPALPSSASVTPGISTENINQSVDFAVRDGRIYYRNCYDSGTIYSVNINGTENRKMSNEWIRHFCVSDGEFYFENSGKDGRLYVVDIDVSNKRRLSKDCSVTEFCVAGGKIYYSSGDDNKLYSMNADGSGKKKLSDDLATSTTMSGDRIYYAAGGNVYEGGIFSIKADGSDKKQLSNDYPHELAVADGWIYYSNYTDGDKLYAMRTDGSGRQKISEDYAANINVAGGRIYYTNVSEEKSPIYSMNVDGSDRRLVSNGNANWLAVWDGRIYYMLTGANIYSMNLDGSGKQLILNVDGDRYKEVTYEVSASLGVGMPKYRFMATGKVRKDQGAQGYVMGLSAFDEDNHPILSADFSKVNQDERIGSPVDKEMMDTMGLHIVDVNFDGYKDVIILNSFRDEYFNSWYDCWLWDAKTTSFIKSESFSEISNPSLDPKRKCIYSTEGYDMGYWGGSIYQYIDGAFVMTNNLDTYEEGLTETELVDGKMEVVRQVTYNREKGEVEAEMEYYKNSELWDLDHPHWYWIGGHRVDKWLGE